MARGSIDVPERSDHDATLHASHAAQPVAADIEMDVVAVPDVGVRRQHHAERLAGLARDLAQEAAAWARIAPMLLHDDARTVLDLEGGDVDREAGRMVAEAAAAAGAQAAAIGANLAD